MKSEKGIYKLKEDGMMISVQRLLDLGTPVIMHILHAQIKTAVDEFKDTVDEVITPGMYRLRIELIEVEYEKQQSQT